METSVQIKCSDDSDDGTAICSSSLYSHNRIKRLESLRSEGVMTDFTIQVKKELFHCHKVVLVEFSPYIQGMLREGNVLESAVNTVDFDELTPAAVDILLKFLYSGSLEISEDKVLDLLFAANMWQVKDVVISCQMFLERKLTPANAISTLIVSKMYNFTDLIIASKKLVCENLDVVVLNPDFVNLPYKDVMGIVLDSNSIPKEVLLNAVIMWIESNLEADKADILTLFSLIPLHLVNIEFLKEKCSSELCQKILSCGRYFKNVIDAIQSSELEKLLARQIEEQRLYNEVYILSGDITPNALFQFNIESGDCNRLDDMPHQHSCCGSACIRKNIFAIDSMHSRSVSKYDPKLNNWTSCQPIPFERSWSAVGVLDQTIYVCGGKDGNYKRRNLVLKYDPVTDEWSSVAAMRGHRGCACAAELNGYLYVVGGTDNNNRYLSSCERYSPLSNSWEIISPLPIPQSYSELVTVNNCMYVIGGWNDQALDNVFKYEVVSGMWSSCPRMPYYAFGVSACVMGNRIFVSGGLDDEECQLHKTAIFDISLNSWTEGPELPHHISTVSSFPVIS